MSTTQSSAPLERGKACLRCRRRKMRCDGARPACGQCQRADRAADCEYADGQGATASQLLEQQVTHLEGRIAEIESAAAPLTLHDPYEAYRRSQSQAGLVTQQRTQDEHDLMRSFFRHASDVGFFLHVERFLHRIATDPQPDHITLLLSTIYVLGAHFMHDARLRAQQPALLARALEQLAPALSSGCGDAAGAIYVLQAEVLLAYFFLDSGRTMEAVYHISAAAAIALACRLHQTRSAQPLPAPAGTTPHRLAPPADGVAEGERVNAFWATFVLERCWGAALGSVSSLAEDEARGMRIDVPWPLDMAGYEQNPFAAGVRGLRTVQTFLQSPGNDGAEQQSILAAHAKAAALFATATQLAARWDPNNQSFQARFAQLDARIEAFKHALPSTSRVDPGRLDIVQQLLVVHLLAHCATLALHKPTEPQAVAYNGRSWAAATAAAGVLQRVNVGAVEFVNPIVSPLLAMVADVVVRGIMTARSQNALTAASRSTLMGPLNQILAALERWSALSPLANRHRTAIQQTLVGL